MSQDRMPANRSGSDDPAEQALCAHIERWTLSYGKALVRFLGGRESCGLHALSDFAWERGVLDLVSPLGFEDRDALRRSGAGLPWAGRGDLDLYWRLMYAACAERAVSADSARTDAAAKRNPMRLALSVTLATVRQVVKPRVESVVDFLAGFFTPSKTSVGAALLQSLQDEAANQVRLRTGTSVKPRPIEPYGRVKLDGLVALVRGYGHDGRVLLDRETPPQDSQGLEWSQEPKRGRWQAWAMPWKLTPVL